MVVWLIRRLTLRGTPCDPSNHLLDVRFLTGAIERLSRSPPWFCHSGRRILERNAMRNQPLPMLFGGKFVRYLCALALVLGAFNLHPLFAQENVDWRYHGNTLDNQRYQDVDQINPHNVHRLKPAWI